MNETIIDRTYVCLKLIDMLYKKGLINEASQVFSPIPMQIRDSMNLPTHCSLIREISARAVW